jgi:hypothetical protein
MSSHKRKLDARLVENLDDLARLNVHLGAPLQLADIPRDVAADAQRRSMIQQCQRSARHPDDSDPNKAK